MEAKHVIGGLQVPFRTPLPKLMPRLPHLTCAVISKNDSPSQLQIPRRKIEQVKSPHPFIQEDKTVDNYLGMRSMQKEKSKM